MAVVGGNYRENGLHKDPVTHLSLWDLQQMNQLARTDTGMRDLLLKCYTYYTLRHDEKKL